MEFKGMEWVRIGSVHFVKCRVVVGNVVSGGGETRAGRCIFSFFVVVVVVVVVVASVSANGKARIRGRVGLAHAESRA